MNTNSIEKNLVTLQQNLKKIIAIECNSGDQNISEFLRLFHDIDDPLDKVVQDIFSGDEKAQLTLLEKKFKKTLNNIIRNQDDCLVDIDIANIITSLATTHEIVAMALNHLHKEKALALCLSTIYSTLTQMLMKVRRLQRRLVTYHTI